jgi:hypothetical protein
MRPGHVSLSSKEKQSGVRLHGLSSALGIVPGTPRKNPAKSTLQTRTDTMHLCSSGRATRISLERMELASQILSKKCGTTGVSTPVSTMRTISIHALRLRSKLKASALPRTVVILLTRNACVQLMTGLTKLLTIKKQRVCSTPSLEN